MTRALPVLIADGALIKLLFFAVVGLIYLISHLINNANRRRPHFPQPGQGQRQPAARGNPNPRDEVGEFLRRAAQRQAAERREAEPPVPAAAQRQPRPRQAAPARAAPPAPSVMEAELVPPSPSGSAVAEHVRHHLDTGEFSRRASGLAQVPQHVSQAIESHLHQVFDHQVGRLATQPTATLPEPAEAAPTQTEIRLAAAGLAPLLADRERLRQAVVLTEILRSPLERW